MGEPVKFLLVDDMAANLDALEALLRRDDLIIVRAASGPEALEQLLVHDFALALIDVNMPGMSGLELAELMRGTARTRTVPIILLTASSSEGRPFKGCEAGAVDYLIKPIDPHMLVRKAEVFFDLDRQRRALLEQRDALEVSEQRFRRTLELAPAPVLLFDAAGTIVSVNAEWVRETGFAAGEMQSLTQWLHQACSDEAGNVIMQVEALIAGKAERLQFECPIRRRDGAPLVWELAAHGIGAGRDGARLFVCIAHDITERAEAERLRQLLVGELNHRVRNTLASVAAIAQQTLRQDPDPTVFYNSFMGRIGALAGAHAQLSEEHWRHADLADLTARQLALAPVTADRFSVSGSRVALDPQVALQTALVLHELATNAVKHGALAVAGGLVALGWSVAGGRVTMTWQELGGPPVAIPLRRGFGSTLITQGTAAVGGTAHSEFLPDGLRCTITLPAAIAAAPQPLVSAVSQAIAISTPPQPDQSALHRRRVLVVEDEPLVALQIADDLIDAGATVVGPAASTEEALALLGSERIDIALLDGNLRGYRSDAVAEALCSQRIPFAFVTGYSRENLPQAHREVPILAKPFDTAQLLSTIGSLLGTLDTALVARQGAAS